MATETAAVQMMGRAFWDPTPTVSSDRRARQLAAALGYPAGWRVVRSIEDSIIADRIYSGKPSTNCDAWFHHEAAMREAATWYDEETGSSLTPFSSNGGHLLPRTALYSKNQKVQVRYQDEWWDAKVLKSRKHKNGDFFYQVQYTADRTKQTGVDELLIRLPKIAPGDSDPSAVAVQQGLGLDWQAFQNGTRWKMIAPDGTVYHSKKAALDTYKISESASNGDDDMNGHDPPWHREGHDYVGRSVVYTSEYKVSSRRSVPLEQVGTIVGWLDGNKDIDRSGNPAYLSVDNGKPCVVFLVRFAKQPAHPYAAHLLSSKELEEHEVEAGLVEAKVDKSPPRKKAKRG